MVGHKTKRCLYFWSDNIHYTFNLHNAFTHLILLTNTCLYILLPPLLSLPRLPGYFNAKVHNCQVMSLLYSISRHLFHLARHCATTERVLNDVPDETALFVALQLNAFECFGPFVYHTYFFPYFLHLYTLSNAFTAILFWFFHTFSL